MALHAHYIPIVASFLLVKSIFFIIPAGDVWIQLSHGAAPRDWPTAGAAEPSARTDAALPACFGETSGLDVADVAIGMMCRKKHGNMVDLL